MSTRRDFDSALRADPSRSPELELELEPEEPTGSRLDTWWQSRSPRTRQVMRFAAPAAVVAIAAGTRLIGLGHPAELVFDETFYVKDAWTLVNLGYEAAWQEDPNVLFNQGTTNHFTTNPSFVVHPPLGKWLIGLGMLAFGAADPVGWRIATAIAGILAVILLMAITRHLTGSLAMASLAGFLMAIEGNAIVMSRVGLLDNFVMLLALAGFGAVLLDRRQSADRLALWMSRPGRNLDWGPALWWRPWLILAAVAFGATAAVKWSGLYFLAAFAVYTVVVDVLARRRAGVLFWFSGTIVKQAPVSFLLTVPVAGIVYLSTWVGWFSTTGGYDRQWAENPANAWSGPLSWVPTAVQSFVHFQMSVYNYHVGEVRPHGYQAHPLTWLFMVRPTGMWYQHSENGQNGCLTDVCGASITGLANPLIWWAATAAAFYLVYRLIRFREWRVGLVLMGLAAGYLPWLLYPERTIFQFYSIAFEPYLLLALVLVLWRLIGSPDDPQWRRESGLRVTAVFLVAATAVSIWFWPLWTGMQLDFPFLALHWWLPGWR